MDRYVLLIRYTSDGVKDATPEYVHKRMQVALNSLSQTLGGNMVSLQATQGPYDFVATIEVKPNSDLTILQCLLAFRRIGDVEITPMQAFDFNAVYPPPR